MCFLHYNSDEIPKGLHWLEGVLGYADITQGTFQRRRCRSQQQLLHQDKQAVQTFESLMRYGTD